MNCDRIARWYRWLEYIVFGRALEQRRSAFLPEIRHARRVLVLGDGDGRALAKLVHAARDARIDYVDLSAKMLALARDRAGDEQVSYIHADALCTPLPEGEYDLIVTHFFLDCLNEADTVRLLERVARAATPGARWLVSEFCQPGIWARWFVGILYLFFRLTTGLKAQHLVDYRPHFQCHGFRLQCIQRLWRGLLTSELWARVY